MAVNSQFGGIAGLRFHMAKLGGRKVASDKQGFDNEVNGRFALGTEEGGRYELTVRWD